MSRDKVAVLGPKGTFTEHAARTLFSEAELLYCDTVEDVFQNVLEKGGYGVVALENSLEGSVNDTMDCLVRYDLKICGEIVLDIRLCLAAAKGTSKEDIKTVFSHQHALAQARRFLKTNFPAARIQRSESTSAAMKEAAEKNGAAALGPKPAAEAYGLETIKEDVQDEPSQTRFIVVCGKEGTGGKTSIIFALRDEPGALYKVLGEFAERNINMTKIESRPSRKGLGAYLFFVDFEGSLEEKTVDGLLASLRDKTTYLKVLGSY